MADEPNTEVALDESQKATGLASPVGGAGSDDAPPVVSEPSAAEGEGKASGAPNGKADGVGLHPAKPQGDWKERRIGKLSAEKESLRKELEAKAARIAELEAGQGTKVEAPVGLSEADVEARAQARAEQIAANQRFNEDCKRIAAEGKEKFPDFDARVGSLSQLMDRNDSNSVGAYLGLVAAAIKTGSGAELLHQLGGDLDEAERLLSLPPVDQALALGKLLRTGGEQVSAAPKPIQRVVNNGTSGSEISPSDPARADKLSTKDWMERRNAEVRERQKARA